MINDHKTSGEWKIQFVIQNKCISSKSFEEMRSVYSASNNIEIFIGSDANEIIDRLFDTMLQRFQEAKETSFERGSEFIFENVDLLYYHFHKIDMKSNGSYVKTPEWLQNKKGTINPKNIHDDNCFQYSISLALYHKDIRRNPKRIPNIIPFISKYNWKEIDFPAEPKDWKKFQQNNKTIALNMLYILQNTEQICCAYKSIYNNERENQVILLIITDGNGSDDVKKPHYLALKSEPIFYNGKLCNLPVKSLSRLLRGIPSNHVGDFYCLNCFNSYSTENRLQEHK